MGEYECTDCNEKFWADEPQEHKDLCETMKERRSMYEHFASGRSARATL